jgi:hypothetical protein
MPDQNDYSTTDDQDQMILSPEEAELVHAVRQRKVAPADILRPPSTPASEPVKQAAGAATPQSALARAAAGALTAEQAQQMYRELREADNAKALQDRVRGVVHTIADAKYGDAEVVDDVLARVAKRLKADDKLPTGDPVALDAAVRKHTEAAMEAYDAKMKSLTGVTKDAEAHGDEEQLDKIAEAEKSGVTRTPTGVRTTAASSKAEGVPPPIEFGTLTESGKFPDEAELERRHSLRFEQYLAAESKG